MRILYGVCGDGFGHSSRAMVVSRHLEEWGHEVKIMTYGRAFEVLKTRFDVFEVSGMEMQFVRGELKKRATLKYNIKITAENLSKWRRFRDLMKTYDPHLCVTDMEPIVPILRFLYDKPLICIDNQHRITHLKLRVPKKYYADYLMAKTVVEGFVAKADHFIITSFSEGEIKRPDTTLVPPVIRDEVRKSQASSGDKTLVYLTRENQTVLEILKQFRERFVIFGYNIDEKENNLELKTRGFFLEELKSCKAIIATAGFTLMSEALYLRKPYLALPLKGQFEQVLNALFLKQAGYGTYSDDLKAEEVSDFLNNQDVYLKKLQDYEVDFNKLPNTLKSVTGQFG